MTARRMLLGQQNMDGRPEMTTWGVAVLFGTTTTELGKWVDLDGDPAAADKLPAWLIQQGRRRTREAQAAVDSGTMTAVLTHWAVCEHGAGVLGFEVVTSEALCQLWMIATPEVAQRIAEEAETT
ncbi:hypothetical protein ABQF35_28595 [Mycobacterium syngnathidarum]